jgi:hypothetical protein
MLFRIQKCKQKAAFAAKPLKQVKLDLKKVAKHFETLFESPVMVLIKVDDCRALVEKHGEIIFRDYKTKEEYEKIAQKVYDESLL